MKTLGATGIKVLKMIHLLFAILWIGGGIALITVLFTADAISADELYMKSRIIQIIDDYAIVPGAIVSFLIGIVYGIWTKWGFFKHNWLTVKWVLTVVQILFGTFALGPWVNENVELASRLGEAIVDNEVFLHNVRMSKIFGTAQVLILLSFIVISVLKPWRPKKKQTMTTDQGL